MCRFASISTYGKMLVKQVASLIVSPEVRDFLVLFRPVFYSLNLSIFFRTQCWRFFKGMWVRRVPTKWFLYHVSLIEWSAHGLANLNAILHDPPVICLLSNLKNKKELLHRLIRRCVLSRLWVVSPRLSLWPTLLTYLRPHLRRFA